MYKRYRSGGETSTPEEKKTDESSNKNKEEAVDELVVKEVEKCWEVIDSQIGKPSETRILPEREKSVSVGAWKTVRVFVSSTFTDFFNEREVLVKKVFPELREWCEERKIQLIECDLRWGVPKDSNTHDTICACMEELDRCFQENDGQPFFLNLLSERFGWVPTETEVPEDIRTRYNWVMGASITLMEILHGAYRTKNPNAAFFVRDGKFLKDIPKEYMQRFSDEKPASKQHLKVLKQKLKQNFSSQVYPYSCHVTGVTEVNGRQRVALSGLEEFAENVITWMKKTITQAYSNQESVKDLSQEEQEAEYHRLFMEKKSEFVIGRNLLVDTLLSYAKGESIENIKISDPATSFVRDSEFWKVCDEDNMVMCVTGAVGHGKTSVMAKVVREALKTGIPVFYHFVGCTGNSRQTEVLVQRLVHTLTGCNTVTDILDKEITDSPVQVYMELLRDKFPKMREKNLEYLLVIDGVNELAEYETHNHLVWLPPKFPGRVRCIVSTANNHPPTINRLQEHRSYVIDVGPIDTETAKEMIRIYFQQYSKKLEAEQIEMIISRPCSQNPIWLWLLMEELRIFGDHRMLAEKIGNISDSVENLLSDIINRLIKEDDTDLIKKMLCLLAASRGGLALQDLLKVTGDPENKEPLPQLYWSKIRRLLKPYLRFVGHREHVVFVHSSILQAVWDNLLCKYGDIKDVHQDLAKYFLNWCDDLATIVDNVPYHCMEAGMKDSLIEFLRKRQEATYIHDFNRSRYFDKFRCKSLADPVIAANMPVVMCRSCTFQKSSFSPRLDRNKTVCILCGAFIFPNNKQVIGHYCMSHSVQSGQNKVIGKCVVCKNMVPKDKDGKVTDIAGMYGQLCMHCSLGFHAKQCCMV